MDFTQMIEGGDLLTPQKIVVENGFNTRDVNNLTAMEAACQIVHVTGPSLAVNPHVLAGHRTCSAERFNALCMIELLRILRYVYPD